MEIKMDVLSVDSNENIFGGHLAQNTKHTARFIALQEAR